MPDKHKNKKREAEILKVFAKHNYYANGITPVELRTTLEDLGPTYVKIGQILSGRPDVLPKEFCDELCTLRAQVKPLEPEIAKQVIEEETGMKTDQIYSEFMDKPVGSASIAQAHYARLLDGTEVVTKIQRPGIAQMMRDDFVILKKLVSLLNVVGNVSDGFGAVDFASLIDELAKVTEEELDFRIEAANTRFFREHCIDDEEKVSCPVIIDGLSTERILTMTFVDGCSISKKEQLLAEGCDLNAIGKALVENFLYQVFDVGTFHADPHQGNIMVSKGKPYWIDFGMIGHISENTMNVLQNAIFALLEKDSEALANAVVSLGASTEKTDRSKLAEDLDMYIDKYMTVRSVSDIDMTELLGDLMDVCERNHIKMPAELTMLVRAIVTIEGVIEELCPELNLFEILSKKVMERATQGEGMRQKLISVGQDALSSARKVIKIPDLTYGALNGLVKGRTKIKVEMTGTEEIEDKASDSIKNIILAMFACFMFLGSCILCTTDIEPKLSESTPPLVAVAGFIFSVALGVYTVRRMRKKK